MPDWSKGDWTKFIGGTGSVTDYMAQYSGGAAPNTGTGDVNFYMAKYGGGTPGAGTGTVADYMAKYGAAPVAPGGATPVNLVSSPAAPAAPAPMPDWSKGDWTKFIG